MKEYSEPAAIFVFYYFLLAKVEKFIIISQTCESWVTIVILRISDIICKKEYAECIVTTIINEKLKINTHIQKNCFGVLLFLIKQKSIKWKEKM